MTRVGVQSYGLLFIQGLLVRYSSRTTTERQRARKRSLIMIGSCLVLILCAVMLLNLEPPRGMATSRRSSALFKPAPAGPGEVARVSVPAATSKPVGASTITEADLTTLSARSLVIPVAGVGANQLHDSFYDERSEGRIHQALDIMAPRDTPVLAAGDGKVMKLHQSERGGIMLYQSDSSGLYVYYYGHLSGFAPGVF